MSRRDCQARPANSNSSSETRAPATWRGRDAQPGAPATWRSRASPWKSRSTMQTAICCGPSAIAGAKAGSTSIVATTKPATPSSGRRTGR
jgi:hypothetical protein